MPTLNWIGKDKVLNHHLKVPFHVLERQYSFDEAGKHEEDNGSENMIIHGDNLLALKSLLPKYEGKIKCIYIDPPYNTGEENWVYNDNVNDEQIKKWIGEVVGKEGEDLTRHDKWLCMMYPRLKLLAKLLSVDGVMAVSIGFHELNPLVLLLKEIFSIRQVTVVTVQTSGGKPKDGFNYVQEYIVFVAPNGFRPNPSLEAMNEYASPYHAMTLAGFNQVTRPNQVYPIYVDLKTNALVGVGKSLQELIDEGKYIGEKNDFEFDYSSPKGQSAVWCVTNKGDKCAWRLAPTSFLSNWQKGYVKITPQRSDKNNNLYSVQYLADGIIKKIESGDLKTYRISDVDAIPTLEVYNFKTGGVNITTIWTDKLYYTNRGSNELTSALGEKGVFPYPKPVKLIEDIISRVTKENDIILDSFAGSATTAHAVLNMNKADGGNRKFICIEMMDYADTITAERVKRVINGYKAEEDKEELLYDEELKPSNLNNAPQMLADAKEVKKAAKESGAYDSVGNPKIVDNHLQVIGKIKATEEIVGTGGNFSYYELGEPLLVDDKLNNAVSTEKIREYIYYMETKQVLPEAAADEPMLLGVYHGAAYYFNYEKDASTTLNAAFLKSIKTQAEAYVIYADTCVLSENKLQQFHITFKKIPRDIARL